MDNDYTFKTSKRQQKLLEFWKIWYFVYDIAWVIMHPQYHMWLCLRRWYGTPAVSHTHCKCRPFYLIVLVYGINKPWWKRFEFRGNK